MKQVCRLAVLVAAVFCALVSATHVPAYAAVICETIHEKPCATLGAQVTCLWNQPAGAVGVCVCAQTASGRKWDCV